jgi:hypothetical protein
VTAPITVVTNMPKTLAELALSAGTLTVMLATATFVPDQDTLVYADDVTDEAAGTSYASPGIPLTGQIVNIDTATNTVTINADDIVVAGLSVSCRWAVIIIDTGVLSTSPVLGYADTTGGGNATFTGGTWDAAGIIPFVVS